LKDALNTKTANYDFESLRTNHPDRQVRRKMKVLYDTASAYNIPTIVELGTDRGLSATMFLQACEQNDGQLVSVDIRDCSHVCNDQRFHFVQSDSTSVEDIVRRKPFLRDGIDVLYVDSLHERRHVEREVRNWWPYLKAGSTVIFDDVDPHIYRPGQRKDNAGSERNWQQIYDFVTEFFWANVDDLELTVHFGSTGLAVISKATPLGSSCKSPIAIRKRTSFDYLYMRAGRRLGHIRAKLGL
jgi:predicted O-methyltransferase YrrM